MPTGSSWGGVSAVNPQAAGDYQQYIDASLGAYNTYADPIFEQQRNAFDQDLINRGIPVGGDSYNSAFQQLDANINDANTRALYEAMNFGLGAQNQDFSQDLARSQLANNALLASWSDDTARYGIDQTTGLGYAGLAQDQSQFEDTLGFNQYTYDSDLANRQYEFDSGLDYDYWNQGNQYDYLYDRADQSDLQWMTGMDYQAWNDQNALNQWSDLFGMQFLDPYGGTNTNLSPLVSNQYASQMGYNQALGNTNAWWSNLGDIINGAGQTGGWW